MTVYPLKNDYCSLYSIGIEKKYNGTSIEYENTTATLLYFYYPFHTRLYIVNGTLQEKDLVQVEEKIHFICTYSDRYAIRIRNLINQKILEEKLIFFFPPLFWMQLRAFVLKRNYRNKFELLYQKYRKGVLNGSYNNVHRT